MSEIMEIRQQVRLNQWSAMVRKREDSGLSVKAYCKQADYVARDASVSAEALNKALTVINKAIFGELSRANIKDYFDSDIPIPKIWGDADGDGEVTILDATVIQRYLADFYIHDPERVQICGDFAGDEIDIIDATLIQRFLASYTVPFPIDEIII